MSMGDEDYLPSRNSTAHLSATLHKKMYRIIVPIKRKNNEIQDPLGVKGRERDKY